MQPHDTSRRSSHSYARSVALHPSLATLTSTLRRRLRKDESVRFEHDFVHHDDAADFFFSLPQKVRRLYFSPDERAILEERYEQPQLLSHPFDVQRAQQRFNDFRFFDDSDAPQERGRPRRRARSINRASASPDRGHDWERGLRLHERRANRTAMSTPTSYQNASVAQIGRASCRERVF